MSRSVSAPSSVTKTSPCWNGLIVPGSTLRYGSNFCSCTFRPRALRSRPSDAATIPFPRADTTPPVTKTYLGARELTGFEGSRVGGRAPGGSGRRGPERQPVAVAVREGELHLTPRPRRERIDDLDSRGPHLLVVLLEIRHLEVQGV